jgi:hypothetical protein
MRTAGNPCGAKWAYTALRPHEHDAGQGRLRQRPRIEVGESTGLGLRGREVQRGRPHTQSLDGSDVVLQPSLRDDTFGNEAELPPLNQRAEAEGVAMTLRRVVASPVVPQAVVCFGPSDDGHRWAPWFDDDGSYPKVGSAPRSSRTAAGRSRWTGQSKATRP